MTGRARGRSGARPQTERFACTCDAKRRVHAKRMIAIVDYGMGNLRSVAKAMEHVAPAETVRITADPAVVDAADRVVFPGQGAMPDCMRYLRESGLEDAVRQRGRRQAAARRLHRRADAVRTQRGGRHAGPRTFPGDGRALPRRGDASAGRLASQGAAHGLEPRAADAGRIRCGMASTTTAGSISCTATTWCLPMNA